MVNRHLDASSYLHIQGRACDSMDSTVVQKVGICRPNDTASHPCEITPLWELHLAAVSSHFSILVDKCTFLNVTLHVCVWSTALQTGRSRFRFPMVSLEFFIDIILPAALWPLGSAQPLTEMSTRNFSWGCKGGRCVGLTALPQRWNLGASTFWNSQGLSRPVQGELYLYWFVIDWWLCSFRHFLSVCGQPWRSSVSMPLSFHSLSTAALGQGILSVAKRSRD